MKMSNHPAHEGTLMTSATHLELSTREAYDDAVSTATQAAETYYTGTGLAMADGEYDALIHAIRDAQDAHPDWTSGRALTDEVAGGQGAGDVPHTIPMLSLDNVFDDDELDGWVAGLVRKLGRPVTAFTIEPKMDGLAIAARYRGGRLVQLVTRGDGTAGEDVTYAAPHIVGLPGTLSQALDIEVRGEVMLTDAQLESANEARMDNGDKPFVNARNGAAGALRGAKSRSYSIPLTFFAYSVISLGDQLAGQDVDDLRHSEAMAAIADLGISTTGTSSAGMGVVETAAEVHTWIESLLARRAELGFGIDGAVIKADLPVDRGEAGFSSRVPRWAIARKFPADTAFSTLEEVLWQVGRTGVVTPRARIAPVYVGGTTISYATLHNPTDLQRKGFMLHDTVTVVRAGEVIPRLEAPVVERRTGQETVIEMPAQCPRCGGDIDRSQVRWRCTRGRLCGLGESIRYATSRDAWDIEGMGDKVVQQLVEAGLVSDVADLFTLTRDQLLSLERMGAVSADKLLANIEGAKSSALSRTVTALGIRGTGRSMSRRLATAFGSMGALRAASVIELEKVDGIGPEKAPVIVDELNELASIIDRLEAVGVSMADPVEATSAATASTEGPLTGMVVVFTGTMTGAFAGKARNEMRELAELAGAKTSDSLSAKTSLLVAGDKAGSKSAKAATLGVQVATPEQFAEMVAAYL